METATLLNPPPLKKTGHWIKQVKVNPDGLGSYLACDIDGIHTNDALSSVVKRLAETKDNQFWLYNVAAKACHLIKICQSAEAAVDALEDITDEAQRKCTVIIHSDKFFI